MAMFYMVIYPRGDRTKLDVGHVVDYERDDWSLASRIEFDSEAEAAVHALTLARKFDLDYVGPDPGGGRYQAYLD